MWRAPLIALTFVTLCSCIEASNDPVAAACEGGAPARVLEIYPTSDTLPENILRFYVYFDAPMRKETVFPEIVLEDEKGTAIDGVFLANRYSLWSPDGTRLTLLLDPGRVKTGLEASADLGRAIENGHRYSLVVGAGVQSAAGCEMSSPYAKSFIAAAADVSAPDPTRWGIEPPVSGTRDPLKVRLDGIHDHVSLAYRIRVQTLSGDPVPGRIDVTAGETEWQFTPRAPWQAGAFSLEVDSLLEDVAGNRSTGVFDDASGDSRRRQAAATPIKLQFRPRPQATD